MKLVYVAGPYTASDFLGVDANIMRARKACVSLARLGIAYVCPHMNSAHMDTIVPQVPPAWWYAMTMEMLKRCDAVFLLDGWGASEGTQAEVDYAKSVGMPVFTRLGDVSAWYEGRLTPQALAGNDAMRVEPWEY